jgi:hypothetical protein
MIRPDRAGCKPPPESFPFAASRFFQGAARLVPAFLIVGLFPGPAWGAPTPELPSPRNEVRAALQKVAETYGRDAVRLQSHLLQNALEGGSVLPASVGVQGVEQHEDRTFMTMNLETGIVYNDASGDDPARYPERVWRDVVEPTLRQFSTLEIPADGIVLRIAYQHGRYRGRDELLRLVEQAALTSDLLTFRLLNADAVAMASAQLSASEALARATVTLNGKAEQIDLGASGETPAPSPPTPARRLLPGD